MRGKMLRVVLGIFRWPYAIGRTMQHDRGHLDLRLGSETLFQRLDRRIARCRAIAMPIGLDRHGDKVGIVEALRRSHESGIVEAPVRRP